MLVKYEEAHQLIYNYSLGRFQLAECEPYWLVISACRLPDEPAWHNGVHGWNGPPVEPIYFCGYTSLDEDGQPIWSFDWVESMELFDYRTAVLQAKMINDQDSREDSAGARVINFADEIRWDRYGSGEIANPSIAHQTSSATLAWLNRMRSAEV